MATITTFTEKTHYLQTRAAVLTCALALFVTVAAALCGTSTAIFFAVLLTDGMLALAWIVAACALGAVILRRLRLEASAPLLTATAGGIGLGIFSLLGLGLGLLGWLNRPVALAFPICSLLLWTIDFVRARQTPVLRYSEEPDGTSKDPAVRAIPTSPLFRWLRAPAGASWLWLVPVMSLAIVLVSASHMPGLLWKPLDPHPYDVTGYHLLVPREWYERGRIVPLEHNVYSFFEMNVEVQFLLLMHATGGPFAAMYACQFLCAGYAGLMVLAVVGACEGKRWKFAPDLPLLGAALTTTVPWLIMLAGVAYVESAVMLYTALAIAWALYVIAHPAHLSRALVLSGICAGFASGAKITAVPMLLLAVPVAVAVVMMIRRPAQIPGRRIVLGCGLLVVAGSLVVSPWLIRNLAWAGNPLFPVGMKALGQDHFDDVQVRRFHDAHSPRPDQRPFPARLSILWRDVLAHWQFGYVLLPAGIAVCFVRWRDRQSWLILICGLFVLVIWIGFTHLLPRFLVMLIPIAGIAVGRIHWGRARPVAVLLLLTGAAFGWSAVIPALAQQPVIIGLEDTSFMIQDSPPLLDARDRGLQIGLVGDAQAFLYPIPLNHLHYRAVFNLHTGTDDPILAWLGPEPIGNPNWLLVVNPAEIERLHATYDGVPALPADWVGHASNVFFLRGDQLRKK